MNDFGFLKGFDKRMKTVSRFSILCENSFRKDTWAKFGIESRALQMNMLFMFLLLIMEHSLREENDCTLSEMTDFVDEIGNKYFKLNLTRQDSLELTKFMLNDVLMNDGRPMLFTSINTDAGGQKDIRVSYIKHDTKEDDGKRITYYVLTDDGYNMLLGTMEMEDNMRLEVSELLFKLHLEKADYSRAVEDIKSYFQEIKKEIASTERAITQIRRNVFEYSEEDYKKQIGANLAVSKETRAKFKGHRDFVNGKIKEFEDKSLSIEQLTDKEKNNLKQLKIINNYLQKALDAHQRVLNMHFDLKEIYEEELSRTVMRDEVATFPIRREIYDKILRNANLLTNGDKILNPLFFSGVDRIFNLEKMFEAQIKRSEEKEDTKVINLEFDTEEYTKEREQKKLEKQNKYKEIVRVILKRLLKHKEFSLEDLEKTCKGKEREQLIPNVEMFKEVLIDAYQTGESDIKKLRDEQKNSIVAEPDGFSWNRTLLKLTKEIEFENIKKVRVIHDDNGETVSFKNILNSETGKIVTLKCSNIKFTYEE